MLFFSSNSQGNFTQKEVQMRNVIDMRIQLPFAIKKQGKYYISRCQVLDVHSQGTTQKRAEENLIEAVSLFLVSCFERGTLDAVLKECGFRARRFDERPTGQSRRQAQYIEVPIPFTVDQPVSAECPA